MICCTVQIKDRKNSNTIEYWHHIRAFKLKTKSDSFLKVERVIMKTLIGKSAGKSNAHSIASDFIFRIWINAQTQHINSNPVAVIYKPLSIYGLWENAIFFECFFSLVSFFSSGKFVHKLNLQSWYQIESIVRWFMNSFVFPVTVCLVFDITFRST